MTNNLQHQAMLANLQTQLNAMQSLAQSPTQTPTATAPVVPDINALVKSAVAAEMAKFKAEQVPQNGGNALTGLLPIIGSALTEQQQLFLSNPNTLMGLPGFLMSKSGKDAVQLLVSEFQTFSKA